MESMERDLRQNVLRIRSPDCKPIDKLVAMWEAGEILRSTELGVSVGDTQNLNVRGVQPLGRTLRAQCKRIRAIWPSPVALRSECWGVRSKRNVIHMLPLLDASTRRKYHITRGQLDELRSAMTAFSPREFIPMLRRFKWRHRKKPGEVSVSATRRKTSTPRKRVRARVA
jgi:hypothetical protein